MCGINLLVDPSRRLGPERIVRMDEATAHRGRDHTEHRSVSTTSAEWHFGHNRLSVIDTSEAANQPMVTDDGRYVLIYNGELYNYLELRESLLAEGAVFHSSGDTEVVLQLLARRGAKGLDALNGMFALVFLDTHEDRAIVARDRSGMKPLYWWHADGRIAVSSELHGVLASGLFDKQLDVNQVNHYLRFRFARKPHTFFTGVNELLEGHYLEISSGRVIGPEPFTTPTARPDPTGGTRDDILNQLEALLIAAIKRHLIADVPVGLLLSGGIDSTLLLALIDHAGLARLETFSIVNDPSEDSFGTRDNHFSRLAAGRYGDYPHVEVMADPSILGDLPDFLARMDQPIADQASLVTYLICKKARESVTVALSGAGADELFGGYNRHDAFRRYLKLRPVLGPASPLLRRLGKKLPTGSDHRFRKQALLAQKFTTAVGDDPADTFRRMQGLGGFHDLATETRPWSAGTDSRAEAQFGAALEQDLHQYLISDILMMNDFQSMQSTLEMRIPYLDRDVLDWVAAVPPLTLIDGGRKWMLGELLRRHDGAEFVERKKEGFNMPLGSWLWSDEHRDLWAFLDQPDPVIFTCVDRELVRELYRSHTARETDRTPELFSVLTLHYWLEANFN
jgi:asparagine synthase (glutamine-hydrolysing)